MALRITACAFMRDGGNWHVMVVTSRSTHRWILPKGHREAKMTDADVAKMEAWEEAGIHTRRLKGGRAPIRIKNTLYGQDQIVFPLLIEKIEKQWPEKKQRERRLVRIDRLGKVLKEKQLVQVAKKLAKRL